MLQQLAGVKISMNFKELLDHPLYLKYKFLIFPILAIFISIGLLLLVVVPQFQLSLENKKSIQDAEDKLIQLQTKISILEQTDQAVYKKYIDRALIAVPSEKDIPEGVSQVLFLLSNNKLNVSDIAVNNTPSKGGLGNFQVKVSVEAKVSDLRDFLQKIKKSSRIMNIKDIEFALGRDSNISANIILELYTQELITSIGEVDKEIEALNQKELEILALITENTQNLPAVSAPSEITGQTGKEDPFN